VKAVIGVPTAGAPAQPFVDSLAALVLPAGIQGFERVIVRGNFVPAQREVIVMRTLELGADVLLMCDDDMVLPPRAFVDLYGALTANPRCAIAGALYYSRDGLRPMAVANWNPNDTTTALVPGFTDQPVAVDGVGFGCVAVRMDAVRELEPLYFSTHVYVAPNAGRVLVCDEDYLFCARLRERGWSVVLHAGVRAGHFDRASGRTQPQTWEPAERTHLPRMAAYENGALTLVAEQPDAPARREHHVAAGLTYIFPR